MDTYIGVVKNGSKQGATLGYPTANIDLADTTVSGIYIARVTVGDEVFNAAVYADQKRHLLEAHLLDFSGDLYGKTISIQLVKKIRDAAVFEQIADLKTAISNDIAQVHEYFSAKYE